MFITFQPVFFHSGSPERKEVKQPQNVRFVVSKAVLPFYADVQLYVFLPSSQMQTVSYKYTRRAGNTRQFRRNMRPEGGLVISLSCHIYFVYQLGINKEHDFLFFHRSLKCVWETVMMFVVTNTNLCLVQFPCSFFFFVAANTQLINRKTIQTHHTCGKTHYY